MKRSGILAIRIELSVLLTVSAMLWADPPQRQKDLTASIQALPLLSEPTKGTIEADWLVYPTKIPTGIYRTENLKELVLTNGLISRTFRLVPNAATVAMDNHITGQSMVRGVKPEATVELDGLPFEIGGLKGQPNYAFLLPEWINMLTSDPTAFQIKNISVEKTQAPFPWKRTRYNSQSIWPPAGIALRLDFSLPSASEPNAPQAFPANERARLIQEKVHLKDVTFSVYYEMYDGIPVLCKWIEMQNGSERPVKLNSFKSEILALVEGESPVDDSPIWMPLNIHAESDYEFGGMTAAGANKTCLWVPDPEYKTQVNYRCQTPCMLVSALPKGPDITIKPGDKFVSFRTYELLYDSSDRERRGLSLRHMYRTV
ncbi:MAG: hypothetical protein ABFD91_08550, partial [Anaerohalosphaeraceae bacterium]